MACAVQDPCRAEDGPMWIGCRATDRADLGLLDPARNVATLRAKISLHVAEPPNMTQRLHLVFGGELVTPQKNVFRDVSQIHIVGMFPDYASAFSAWSMWQTDWVKPPWGPSPSTSSKALPVGSSAPQEEPAVSRNSSGIGAALLGFIPKGIKKSLMAMAPVRRVRNAVMKDLGLPEDMLTFVNYPTRFDCRETLAALKGSGVTCPNLKDYAWRLWDYWERNLDPELFIDRSLKGTVAGKVVLITGGSSGIGLAAAHKFAEAGATTIICGRDQDKLDEACAEAKAKGYQFIAYSADIADMTDCDRFVQLLIDNHGGVDFLINNAGRSIRRAIESSYDRFHDYERTMQLNYFGCLRVTMGFLPGMVEKRKGHVVNISSIGVLTNAPRFSAYVASKAALDAWTRCASSEFADQGITFTTINMPLVRTPMIAPTKIYQNVPTLAPEEAADMIAQACIYKPVRIATRLGITGQVMHALVPRVAQIVMNTSFRMFPDSSAAKGDKGARPQLSPEAIAMQQMMRGIHF